MLSARYAGETASDEEKCLRILEEMRMFLIQNARRGSCASWPLLTRRATKEFSEGPAREESFASSKEKKGFGYDPIFLYEQAGRTFAEMDRQSKNEVSHRGRALRQFVDFLRQHSQT